MILLTAGETYERMFGIDWQLLADSTLTIIAVFVLFAIMSYFLFNPARKMLNDRQAKIKGELDDAKNSMEEANRLREEYEAKLRDIDKEAESILSDARKRALAGENKIIAEAKEEAARIMERARVEAELEKQKVSDEVKREIISVASLMAGKVVAASIDTKVQDQLIDETLKEMGKNTWLS
ncbi:MAG: F0F1 ATP synthase subunit B [Clostridium sp.]|nr:F0F1 ATP synthase subunit B [Acetatifactor muris]MCM1525853.1 F0F1 ATP synthase subunit B [Bacteroides sp.]MCM1562607.1 F0F1 ATP synthase subunit B [Clostridium sp.]